MKLSTAGINFLKDYEALRLTAYQDSKGVWTIGYGHTGPEVKRGMVITEFQAEEIFRLDVGWAEAAVNQLVTVPLLQRQFDALVCWVFNVGTPAMKRSTLLALLNQGNYNAAADQLDRWIRVVEHGVSRREPGLVSRRFAEKRIYLTGVYAR